MKSTVTYLIVKLVHRRRISFTDCESFCPVEPKMISGWPSHMESVKNNHSLKHLIRIYIINKPVFNNLKYKTMDALFVYKSVFRQSDHLYIHSSLVIVFCWNDFQFDILKYSVICQTFLLTLQN